MSRIHGHRSNANTSLTETRPEAPRSPNPLASAWTGFLDLFRPHVPAPPPHVAAAQGAFRLDGKPTFLWGGEVQYFRIRDKAGDPVETERMWEDTLDTMVDSGMNLITTYVPWDYHASGSEYDFSKIKDLRKFLTMAKERGIHVVLKPGPAITGEWPRGFGTFGAVPEEWKAAHPESMEQTPDGKPWSFSPWADPRSRQPALLDPTYLSAVDGWYERFAQEIKPFLGSTIVGIQLDNETNLYWGNRFGGPGYAPSSVAHYRGWLAAQYGGDIAKLNAAYSTTYGSFDEVRPPARAPKPGDGTGKDQEARDWLEAGRALVREYLSRLRSSLERKGLREPEVAFLTNDAPFAINNGNSLVHNVLLPDGKKNQVGIDGADLYPKFDLDPRTLQSQPFQADFYTRLFEAWTRSHAAEGGVAFGAEIQGGMYSFIPGFRPNVRPEATDQILARTIGRGMKGVSMYVLRDGLNADGSDYSYQAAITRTGIMTRRQDVLEKWGRFIQRYGEDLLSAEELIDPVAVLYDPGAAAPSGGVAREQQLRLALDTPGIFGWLAAAGLNPAVLDAGDPKLDLAPYSWVLRMKSPHPSATAGAQSAAGDKVVEVGGEGGPSEALVRTFNRGDYYLQRGEELEGAINEARLEAARRGIAPSVSARETKALAWGRRSKDNLYLFCVNDSGRARSIHVGLQNPYPLGLIKVEPYTISDGATGEVLAKLTGKELLEKGLDVAMDGHGARVLVVRSARLPAVPEPRDPALNHVLKGLVAAPDEAAQDSLYRMFAGRYPNTVGLDDLGRTLADPVGGRRVANYLRSELHRRVWIDAPQALTRATLGKTTDLVKRSAVSPGIVRPLYQTITGLQGAGLIPASDYRPPELPSGFDLANLSEAPVQVPEYGMRELAPGVLLGDFPGPVHGKAAVRNSAFAALLNTLADNEAGRTPPVPISYQGRSYTKIAELLEALRQNGHQVTARVQERIANFLPLLARSQDGSIQDVPAPIMLRTGLKDEEGKEVVAPAVHAEWAFEIRPGPDVKGPRIEAETTWFLGTGASAAFYPNGLVERRAWQGHKERGHRSGPDAIRAIRLAAAYGKALERTVEEERIVGGAYGVLGVCQDSVAVVEQALDGKTGLFPLLQDAQKMGAVLDAMAQGERNGPQREIYSTLASAVRALPHDYAVGHTTRERVLASLPHDEGRDPFEVSERARRVLTHTEPTMAERGVPMPGRAVAHGFRQFETLAALRPSEMSTAFKVANEAHDRGLIPDPGAKASPGAGALDMENGVYRLDAVTDRNLGSVFELEKARSIDVAVREPARQELLPGLLVGYAKSTVSEEQRRLNMVFAEVFDRLAENVLLPPDKQFEARAGGKAYRRLDEFLEALSELGYRVEVSIEGQAAHATGLAYRDETEAVTEIPTPILVRTGIKDTFGQEAIVPALHSSLAIRVRSTPQSKGPRVDADLSWYTGLRGTHFYPANLYADPKWAGHVDIDTLSTAEAQRAVHLAGVFGAATNEYASAEGLWLNGYGVLGVCNDAVAAIQAALRGKTSLFPLLMDRGEDEAALGRVAALGDARDRSAVEELLKQVRTLPTDHGSEPSLRERALKSLPSLADGSMLPIARGARRILTGEKPAATATGASPNRLRAMFDRMDSRKASRVARADVQGYLEDLGLGTGFLGPQIVQNGSRVFLERLDEDGDQTVTYEELVRRIPQLLPKGLRGASGSLEASQIDPAMDAIAGPGADRASLGQLVAYLRDEYTREARDQFARAMASKVAEVAGRVALDILDGDGDGYFTKEDLKALLAETQRKSERGKA